MEMLFEIAIYVLVVGGALCILLLLRSLISFLAFLAKIRALTDRVQQGYEHVVSSFFIPIQKIQYFIGRLHKQGNIQNKDKHKKKKTKHQ